MKVELENVLPREIEARSFEIITQELGDTPLIPGTELIVKRCIHTSADFDYAKNLRFSEGVVEKALKAIQNGASIVTDTQMARAGINKKALARYGGEVYCFMSDEDVARKAKEKRHYQSDSQHGQSSISWDSADLCHRKCSHGAGASLRTH